MGPQPPSDTSRLHFYTPRDGAPRPSGLARRAWARLIVALLILGLFLFASAGTTRWPAAWAVLAVYGMWAARTTAWLLRHDRALLKERIAAKLFREGQKAWDKRLTLAVMVVSLTLLVLPGLDAVRFGWTRVPPIASALGLIGLAAALGVVSLVFKANSFASTAVKIDLARGHRVATTGPYRYVRHPMYVAVILASFCWALALGSLLTLIPAALTALLLILRTSLEDRTLHAELAGYSEYARRTRYRLVPRVW